MCQGLGPVDGGDPDVLALGVLTGSPEYEVYDGLVEAVAWAGQVLEGFDGELGPALLKGVPAQGSVQGPALEGCSEEVGVADGGRCEGGVLRVRLRGLAGWVAGVLRIHIDVWVALAGLGWAEQCLVAPWVRGGLWGAVVAGGGGVLRWGLLASWGALVVSSRPADGDGGGVCWARSGLVHFWVMYSMVMDETLHVLPGGGVGELFHVCQQEAFAVYHLGRCSAHRF